MTILLEFRERLKGVYSKYEVYFRPLLRFALALIAFFVISQNVGFMTKLQNPALLLVLALVCAFLPPNATIFVAAGLIIANLYTASVEFALVLLVIFLLLCLLYLRFAPTHSYVLLLMPVACAFQIPFAVPLVMGLVASPVVAVPIACGTMIYYLLEYAKVYAASMSGSDIENMFQKYEYIIEHALNNKEMFLMMVTLVAAVILVYIIRRLSMDYAWIVAIAAGALALVLLMLSGDYIMEVPVDIPSLIVGIVVSVLIALLVQFFVFHLDYTRTERVQFEDDEYYYYVKAVPKVVIATKDKSVKRITVNRRRDSTERTKDRGESKDITEETIGESIEETENPEEEME